MLLQPAEQLPSIVYRNYKKISLINNLVSLNNNIFQHIVRCFNSQYWSRFTHTALQESWSGFQRYNQGYRKTSNN